MSERAFTFPCNGADLIGVLHGGAAGAARGVLIVVGGPQYRVGSHRQFVLLARDLARAGVPVMRFDCRGMGDAGGEPVDFEHNAADIAAALDAFFDSSSGLREAVLWGLCDAAAAALLYAWRDPRVTGLALLNPWARTEAGEARAYLKHYYWRRLFSPDLWRKIGRGEFQFIAAARSLVTLASRVAGRAGALRREDAASTPAGDTLPERMGEGLARFTGRVLLLLSGNDLTAAEFNDTVRASDRWRALLQQPRVTRHELAAANHTFARREWRQQVMQWTLQWLTSW